MLYASLLSRFKHDFEPYIEQMFQLMVDYTEPICRTVDSPPLAQMLTFDTFGVELYVSEINPKTLNALIRKLKTFYEDNPNVNPYKWPHALPGCLLSRCRTYVLATDISFLDDDTFKSSHPELIAEKKSDSPDEDKHNPNIIHFS